MDNINNIENFYSRSSSRSRSFGVGSFARSSFGTGGGRFYGSTSISRSHRGGSYRDSSYRRTTSPPAPLNVSSNPVKKHTDKPKQYPVERRMTSTTHTLGGTGGGPFWGWWYSPFVTYLYPIFEEPPIVPVQLVEIEPKEIKKETKEKYTNIKIIYPTYK